MTRFLYNINEWFNNLQIHQQVIYALAVITPMIVGTLIGTLMSFCCGHLIYLLGFWVKEKGDKVRRDLDRVVSYHLDKCINMRTFGKAFEYKHPGNSRLIGLIMADKIYEEETYKGHNIGFD